MPRKIVKAPLALSDIERFYIRGARDFGDEQAERLHREIYRRFDLLAENPFLGVARDSIAAGLHLYFLPAPCIIAYRHTLGELIVLRVFHGREDYQAILSIAE